jgi:lysozyme
VNKSSKKDPALWLVHQTSSSDATANVAALTTELEPWLAGIVDSIFNLGAGRLQTSTLRRRVNQQDWLGAGQELRRWVNGGRKMLPGLIIRKCAEFALINPA